MSDQSVKIFLGKAKAEDMIQVRALLPNAFAGERRPGARIAKRLDTARIFGAVAWWRQTSAESTLQAAFLIWIGKTRQSRGICTALVRGVMADASEAGVSELVTGSWIDEGEAANDFLTSIGFNRKLRLTEYEQKVERFGEIFTPISERYKARHKIPEGAKLVSLDEAHLEEVRELILHNLGGLPHGITRRLQSGPDGYDRDLSVVLTIHGKVKGALLSRNEKGINVTDTMVVAPEMRGGWASLFLKQASFERSVAAGIEIIRYSADEKKHPDTVKQAARTGAKIIGYKVILGIDL